MKDSYPCTLVWEAASRALFTIAPYLFFFLVLGSKEFEKKIENLTILGFRTKNLVGLYDSSNSHANIRK